MISGRILKTENSDVLKNLRLSYMTELGHPYLNLLKMSEQQEDCFWENLSTETSNGVFIGLFLDDKIAGICGVKIITDKEFGLCALGYGAYVMPQYRKQRLSKAMYMERIRWCKNNNYNNLIVFLHSWDVYSQTMWKQNGAQLMQRRTERLADGIEIGVDYYNLPL